MKKIILIRLFAALMAISLVATIGSFIGMIWSDSELVLQVFLTAAIVMVVSGWGFTIVDDIY